MLLSSIKGDSGYGQQPWLFTPIETTETLAEEHYNKVHRRVRSMVERCIGVLKSRFRCLCRQRILMYDTARSGNIIIACAVLHNIMVQAKYPDPPEKEIEWNIYGEVRDAADALDFDADIQMGAIAIRAKGYEARSHLIRESF